MRFLYFFLFLICLDVFGQEYVKIIKETQPINLVETPNIKVILFIDEIFKLKSSNTIEYGKRTVQLDASFFEEVKVESNYLEFLKNRLQYINPIENNDGTWQFDMTKVPHSKESPIFIYKKNGKKKNNGKKDAVIFEIDSILSISKNDLGETFRIAIKNVPSIVYDKADVEEKLNSKINDNKESTSANSTDLEEESKDITIASLDAEKTTLQNQLNDKNSEITNLRNKIENKDEQIKKLSKGNIKDVDFKAWRQNPYSLLFMILSGVLLSFIAFLLFTMWKNSDSGEEESSTGTTGNPDNPPIIDTESLIISLKNIMEAFKKDIEHKLTQKEENDKKTFGNITDTLIDLEKNIKNAINSNFSDFKLKIEKLAKKNEKNVSVAKSHSTPIIHSSATYQSFINAAKTTLDLLDKTVGELKKKNNSPTEKRLIKNFTGKTGLGKKNESEEKRKIWNSIIEELQKSNTITNKDLKHELNNYPNKIDKIHELFFNKYLQEYLNKSLILIEEFRNLNSFSTKNIESATDQNLKKQIENIINTVSEYFDITIHYTPLFLKPKLDYEYLVFGNLTSLTDYYKPFKKAKNIRQGGVIEIVYFGMEGKYQNDSSRAKTKIIAK